MNCVEPESSRFDVVGTLKKNISTDQVISFKMSSSFPSPRALADGMGALTTRNYRIASARINPRGTDRGTSSYERRSVRGVLFGYFNQQVKAAVRGLLPWVESKDSTVDGEVEDAEVEDAEVVWHGSFVPLIRATGPRWSRKLASVIEHWIDTIAHRVKYCARRTRVSRTFIASNYFI